MLIKTKPNTLFWRKKMTRRKRSYLANHSYWIEALKQREYRSEIEALEQRREEILGSASLEEDYTAVSERAQQAFQEGIVELTRSVLSE